MILSKNQLLIATVTMFLSASSFARTKTMSFTDNSKVPPQNYPAPTMEELGFFNDNQVEELSSNFKAESKRRPSGAAMVGTEDMLSQEYIAFRNQLLKVRSGIGFSALIEKYDADYDKLPESANDLKFTIARLAAWLPMKGIIWRMTPMVHKVASSQAAILATLKNFAEQVKINMPDSQAEAQMLFLSMPTPDLVGKEFKFESDFVIFLAKEVYPSLKKSVKRLETIHMYNIVKGQQSPTLFDGKIRFGDNAFSSNYDDYERFKVVGEAERFASLARIHRRMYSIAVMNAYNWNGHLALKREIGKMYGVGVAESALFDSFAGADNVYLRGVSRKQRTLKMKSYTNLYTLTQYGQNWMDLAYFHLHMSGLYLAKTWDSIKGNTNHYVAQIDPDIFMARKEQVEVGMLNIKKLTGAYGKGVSGLTKINGTLSGEEVEINIKDFFEHAPRDLKNLLPTSFSGNEDLNPLKQLPTFKNMNPISTDRDVMAVTFPGHSKSVNFRNYLFGRAKGWNTSKDAYGRLFPEVSKPEGIVDAMRILNETRGSRLLTSGLTMFVR